MYSNLFTTQYKKNRGSVLVSMLVFTGIALVTTLAFVRWGTTTYIVSKRVEHQEMAYHIAEAGIEYYRWHLAHSPLDYKDGTNRTDNGPFTHEYLDRNDDPIGEYDLYITPPSNTEPYVRIRSVGRTYEYPDIDRSIIVDMAFPSLVQYAIASNSDVRIGEGTEVIGPVHSNAGIRFDGIARNIVSSSLETYNDPDHTGADEWSVHTHINGGDSAHPNNPTIPTEDHPEVFTAGREFSATGIDFNSITADLASMKTLAQEINHYYPPSNAQGWHLILKTNGTYDVYTVNTQVQAPQACPNQSGSSSLQAQWGTWSIQTETFYGTYTIPNEGIIFVEDHVWVDGQISGSQVTIAAARLPDIAAQRKNIIVNNDLLYSSYTSNSVDTIGLIAQNNIIVGLKSENDLRIDAALVAQQGRVGRYYYTSGCGSEYVRQAITSYGAIISNQRYGFAYTDNTGYSTRTINYDPRLFYVPPPNFPRSSNQYVILRWEEEI